MKRDQSGSPDWTPQPQLSNAVAYALATITIVLRPLAFADFDIWPLAFVCWVPLLVAMRGRSARQTLALGMYAGFGITMFGFYWLVDMLQVFGGFPVSVGVVFASVLCIQMAGRFGLTTYLYGRATRNNYHHGLAFMAAFATSELLYPLLFPWYFGGSVHQVPVLLQVADIGGPILVSLVVVSVNLAIAELLQRPVFKLAIDKRTVAAGIALPLAAIAYGSWRIQSVDAIVAKAESAKIGMVQGNIPLKNRRGALAIQLKRTAELRKKGVDLVVWSEAAASGALREKGYKNSAKRRITGHLGVPAIVGGVIYERLPKVPGNPKARRSRFFNTALMADAQGNITGRYDKQFLLMFGEYLPFGDAFPKLYEWSPNSGRFSPGTSLEPLKFGDHRISTMICYEDIIPSFVNKLVAAGSPDLLVNMTNDAWFGNTAEPWQHFALSKLRSVEHHIYMVRVTNSGVTAIVDPVGRVTVQGDSFKEQALVGEVRFVKIKTLFATLGMLPWWLVAAATMLACFVRRRGSTGRRSAIGQRSAKS